MLTLTNSTQSYSRKSGLYLNTTIDKENIKVVSNVKVLGGYIDRKFNFNLHIDTICRSSSNQRNALVPLKKYLGLEEKSVLVNRLIYSNFNYCSFAWVFASKNLLNKVTILKKNPLLCLRRLYYFVQGTLIKVG